MKVLFVGAGPGDPALLTVKADRLLREARCCIHAGSLVNPQILELLPEDCERHDSAGMTLEQVLGVIRQAAGRGVDVIRLHTGDPTIYSAIGEQIQLLQQEGIAYEVVPGVSSFQAAAAALACELTQPEVSQTVMLSRVAGRTPVPEGEDLETLAETGATLCLFLSVGQIRRIAEVLARQHGPYVPVHVVYRASWPDQRVISGTAADIAGKVEDTGMTRTALVLAGRALRLSGTRSKLYDPAFDHGYRKADTP